mmetsp:Transcript_57389/g.164781  ORF Transcript_57389/g.164781 Transcript_57389/m.164781 type:complete len:227 (+) Transcript_57389:66-746(+)
MAVCMVGEVVATTSATGCFLPALCVQCRRRCHCCPICRSTLVAVAAAARAAEAAMVAAAAAAAAQPQTPPWILAAAAGAAAQPQMPPRPAGEAQPETPPWPVVGEAQPATPLSLAVASPHTDLAGRLGPAADAPVAAHRGRPPHLASGMGGSTERPRDEFLDHFVHIDERVDYNDGDDHHHDYDGAVEVEASSHFGWGVQQRRFGQLLSFTPCLGTSFAARQSDAF